MGDNPWLVFEEISNTNTEHTEASSAAFWQAQFKPTADALKLFII